MDGEHGLFNQQEDLGAIQILFGHVGEATGVRATGHCGGHLDMLEETNPDSFNVTHWKAEARGGGGTGPLTHSEWASLGQSPSRSTTPCSFPAALLRVSVLLSLTPSARALPPEETDLSGGPPCAGPALLTLGLKELTGTFCLTHSEFFKTRVCC